MLKIPKTTLSKYTVGAVVQNMKEFDIGHVESFARMPDGTICLRVMWSNAQSLRASFDDVSLV